MKRRKRTCYIKGTMITYGTINEILDGNSWRPQEDTDICISKDDFKRNLIFSETKML